MLTLPGPIVSVGWLAEHLADPLLRVVDVRWALTGPPGRERYAAGHLPGAIFLDIDRDVSSLNAPWSDNLDDGGRFRPAEQLRERYEVLGAGHAAVVASCGSGITAAHDLLAMELAGLGEGRLYEGSWSDWSSDRDRPVATGAAP